jgi:hypothetical protein
VQDSAHFQLMPPQEPLYNWQIFLHVCAEQLAPGPSKGFRSSPTHVAPGTAVQSAHFFYMGSAEQWHQALARDYAHLRLTRPRNSCTIGAFLLYVHASLNNWYQALARDSANLRIKPPQEQVYNWHIFYMCHAE